MKNIWMESAQFNHRIDNENIILYTYLISGEQEELKKHITKIVNVTIDEFWRPEAFIESDDYCSYMMKWKPALEHVIPQRIFTKITALTNLPDDIFKSMMSDILDDIQFYHELFKESFESSRRRETMTLFVKQKC